MAQNPAPKITTPSRRRYSAAQRRAILQAFHRSGLSVHAFSGQYEFAYETLRRWIRDAADEQRSEDKPDTAPELFEIELAPPPEAAPRPMEIVLPGGAVLRVASREHVAWARELIADDRKGASC